MTFMLLAKPHLNQLPPAAHGKSMARSAGRGGDFNGVMTMNRYTANYGYSVDGMVVALRRAGFTAWRDSDLLLTDAALAVVLLIAGHGQSFQRA